MDFYNIDNNTFSEKYLRIGESSAANHTLKTYYFPETNQYSIIYFYKKSNTNKAGIVILDENFNQILNETTIINQPPLNNKEFSLIYSITNEEYILFYVENKQNGNLDWEIKYNSSIFHANYTNYYSFINNSMSSISIVSSNNYYSYISQNSSNLYILNSSYIYSSSSILMKSTSSFSSPKTISSNIASSFISSTFLTTKSFSSSQIGSFSSNIHKTYTSVIISNSLNIINEDKIIRNKTDIPKEEIGEKLDEIIKLIEIGKKYEISGDDFVIEIKPINSSSLKNSTHINFNQCENILRKENNISSEEILTFLQMERWKYTTIKMRH